MNLYLTRSGRLRRRDNTLRFEQVLLPADAENPEIEFEELEDTESDTVNALPVESIDAIYIFGEISVNSKLINFLNSKKIPLHFFNYYGNHTGTLYPHAEQLSGDLVIRQAAAYQDSAHRLELCKALLASTFHNIRSVVQYYQRRKGGLENAVAQLEELEHKISDQSSPDSLMGLEGNVRHIYYQSWHQWLGSAADQFQRVYHPPDNPLNALISFVNGLLYTACVSELYRTALYPGISYLHTPQTRRFSLALDLVEPFKPIMADRLIFRLWNGGLISEKDFREYSNGFLLTDDARRKLLQEWDTELRRTVQHPTLNRSVSYRQLLRLDCYKLVNHLLDGREYQPYRISY